MGVQPNRYEWVVKRIGWLFFLAASLVGVIGCGQEATPDAAAAQQAANAKILGVATPEGVKRDAGAYTPDVNFAKSIVSTQQKREARENANVTSISGPGR